MFDIRSLGSHSHEQLRFINEVSMLRSRPFERAFRRSYVKEGRDAGATQLRQSDGYFKMPGMPVPHAQQRPKSNNDALVFNINGGGGGGGNASTSATRSSLHNLTQQQQQQHQLRDDARIR